MIDDHAHPVVAEYRPLDLGAITLDLCPNIESDSQHQRLDFSRYVEFAMRRELARELNCDEASVVDVRNELAKENWSAYVRRLFAAAGVSGVIFDGGGVGSSRAQGDLCGVSVWELSRIETHLDPLMEQGLTPGEIRSEMKSHLAQEIAKGSVGFKSVLAYRSGLEVNPDVTQRDAERQYDPTTPVRSRGKALRDLVLCDALELCSELSVPIQIHTGYGDSELRLTQSSPLLLEALLNSSVGRRAKIVLIHGAYPYYRELAYMASVRRNVYAEVSLVPLFSPHSLSSVLAEILGSVPLHKVSVGSDGHGQPETHYFANLNLVSEVRAVVGQLFGGSGDRRYHDEIVAMVTETNAQVLYRLEASR